jgi:hypothetical protein
MGARQDKNLTVRADKYFLPVYFSKDVEFHPMNFPSNVHLVNISAIVENMLLLAIH